MRTALRKARTSKVVAETPGLVSLAVSSLDKAAKRNIIHHRTAARIKSRLMKQANRTSA